MGQLLCRRQRRRRQACEHLPLVLVRREERPGSGRWPKKLRYVELRLNAPQYPAGLLGYAVRCVQVVGPPVERGLSVKVREAAGVPKAE